MLETKKFSGTIHLSLHITLFLKVSQVRSGCLQPDLQAWVLVFSVLHEYVDGPLRVYPLLSIALENSAAKMS